MEEKEDDLSHDAALAILGEKRAVLRATLASTPDMRLLNAVWAIQAVHAGNADRALKILKHVPDEAIGADISSGYAIHPWELELLVNERLAVSPEALFQHVAPESWPQIAGFTNLIRSIENAESAVYPTENPLADLLFKIANRQFEWQIGFLTRQQLFRTAFVYGQGLCADYFQQKYGISVDDFSAVCFAYYALFLDAPNTFRNVDLSLMGISTEIQERALSIITRQVRTIKSITVSQRHIDCEIAYKPSPIRMFPIIGVSARSYKICCPLPELLANRMTYGLFYDVIGGGGSIREEIGSQFEKYLETFFHKLMPDIDLRREFTIHDPKGARKSCDMLICENGSNDSVQFLLECKATRLSYSSRFKKFDKDDRGYQDMIKGVIQIWRTASDIRKGNTPYSLLSDAVGTIITLDAWFLAAPARQDSIIHEASLRVQGDVQITKDDMLPIAFIYMPELERSMMYSDKDSLIEGIIYLSKPENRGYSLDHFAVKNSEGITDQGSFPFEDKIGDILPWWGRITELRPTK